MGFPDGSVGKESTRNAGDEGSIPGSGRSSGGRNGNPLLYSCLENPMDRGAWWATICRVTKSQTGLRWLSRSMHLWSVFSHSQLFATLWTVACQALLVHAIFQARIQEWVAISSSRGSSIPRDGTAYLTSPLQWIFYCFATWETIFSDIFRGSLFHFPQRIMIEWD